MTSSVRTYVRCEDRMVFKIDPETLKPLGHSFYDPYCFSNPEPDVNYLSHTKWCLLLQEEA